MTMKFVYFWAMVSLGAVTLPTTVRGEDIPGLVSPTVHAAAKPLNDLFSKQWVRLGDEGQVEGQLVDLTVAEKRPLAGVPVVLVRDGQIVQAVQAGNDGAFRFENVEPGHYSLVSRTNESFAAFSLQVLSQEAGKHLSTAVEVRPIRSAGERIQEIVRAQVVPPFLTRLDGMVEVQGDPLASERRFANSHLVKLDEQGKLHGQLAKPGLPAASSQTEGMSVFVLKEGVEVARVEADAEGRFVIAGLSEGVYGFIAAGSGGVAATSFQVIDPGLAAQSQGKDGKVFVAVNLADCCPTLNCEVVATSEVACCEPQVVETIIEAPVVAACEQPVGEVVVDECGTAPACGGCGCGWGGGGGGWGGGGYGGGGGSGMGFGGGLIGLAGLAGIAAVLADDNDDQNFNQPPIVVSPVQ